MSIPQISYGGTLDQTWEKYDLLQRPVYFDGAPSGHKAIFRKGKLVNIVSTRYQLLPNEEAVRVAEEAAKASGMKPFSQFGGNWFMKMKDHVIYDNEQQHKVHALYCRDESYEVNGDKMYLGVGVHNSIDGLMGFGAGIFTFRNACSNMVFAGFKGWNMAFDQRKTLDYVYAKHISGTVFTVLQNKLKAVLVGLMDHSLEILDWYKLMAITDANRDLIDRFQKLKLPKNVTPPYLVLDKNQKQLSVPQLTQWEIYNDVTALIWHNNNSDMRQKAYQFRQLHRIMQPNRRKGQVTTNVIY